jgi:hypothetical protein
LNRVIQQKDSPTTKECLTTELGQLLCMVALLVDQKVVDETDMLLAMEAKKIKLEKWSSIFQRCILTNS